MTNQDMLGSSITLTTLDVVQMALWRPMLS